ncbi:hypothetical protein SHKM778_41770 [Streptomyces sp. KM77-8]|uniref:Uncharacterized protein n=1 Tax=Streptomyces haneummycinicus TaxID=3074435 RepID=A0AAT9HJT1_9ACTN
MPRKSSSGDAPSPARASRAAVGGVWNVFVRPAAGARPVRVARLLGDPARPVRIARLLDDLADREGVFVLPRVTVDGRVVRPYRTIDNDLAVEVTAAG